MEDILNRIIGIRKAKKISQKEVSESLGISQAAYAKFESGNSITVDRLYKITEFLGVSINEILDIKPTKRNEDLNASLILENEKLKKDLQIQTSLLSAFEMLQDNKISNKKELKYLKEKIDLLNTFQLLDNNLFLRYNQQFANSNSLISTFDIACVEKFHKYYGSKASKEIMKYIDIEKYKNSSTFDFLVSFWEGDETWSRERIVEWVEQERKKLT